MKITTASKYETLFPLPTALGSAGAILASMTVACSGGGHGGPEPPAAPLTLGLMLASLEAIDISWVDASSDEDGFLVQRADDLGGAPGTFGTVGEVPAGHVVFQDGSVLEDTAYWYRVLAFRGSVQSSPSDALAVRTLGAASGPTAPDGLQTVAVSANAIELIWNDLSADEDGFLLERALDLAGVPGKFARITQLGPNTEHYLDTGLQAGTSYWYRVRAFRALQASRYTDAVQGILVTGSPVNARTDVITLAGDQSLPKVLIEDDGRYFLSAYSEHGNTILLAFAADHSLLWQKEFAQPVLLRRSTDGNLWFFTPFLSLAGKVRASDGAVVWARSYDYPLDVEDEGPNGPPLDSLFLTSFDGSQLVVGELAGDGSIPWMHGSGFPPTERKALSDGGFVAYGSGMLVEFTADGAEAWERVYAEEGVSPVSIESVHECSDGDLLVFSYVAQQTFWMAKIGANGGVVSQKFAVVPGLTDSSVDTAEDPDGGHFVLAEGGGQGPVVFHFDSLGSLQWSTRVETPSFASAQYVLPRQSGGCYLVGNTFFAGGGTWVVALDDQGNLEWERVLQTTRKVLAFSMVSWLTGDDGVFVVGGWGGSSLTATWAAKIDSRGDITYSKAWQDGGIVAPRQVRWLGDGTFLAVGAWGDPVAQMGELWTARFDSLGNSLGSARLHGLLASFDTDDEVSIGLRPDGQLVFAYAIAGTSKDIARTLLRELPSDVGSGTACIGFSAPSTEQLVAIPGVALTSDPTIDVTASHHVIGSDWGVVNPMTVGSQPYSLPVFLGTTVLTEGCAQ